MVHETQTQTKKTSTFGRDDWTHHRLLDVMIGTGCYHGLWSMLRSDNQELNFL
jgi:hypothetical protein